MEVQAAREKVFGLFNSLNIDDEFDIVCRNLPRTGTRIPQRVCRPNFSGTATSEAGQEFADALFFGCEGGLNESCLEAGRSRAQAAVSAVSINDQRLSAEVQRLIRENGEFREAIVGYESMASRYEDARRAAGIGLHVSASMIGPAGRAIPSGLGKPPDDVVAPKPIELVTPDEASLVGLGDRRSAEGWVKLRFSVRADGATADVSVVDTMPPALDPSSVLEAVRSWTFEPATRRGTAVDWHNALAIVVFNRERAANTALSDFAVAYEDVAKLVADGRYADAKAGNERMQREFAASLEEMAFSQMQLAAIEHAMGDSHEALDAIRLATEPAVDQLAEDELKLALEHRFALEVELGLAADAVRTYQRRTDLGRLPSRDSMEQLGAKLEKALKAGDTGLAEHGRLGPDGVWAHALTWPTFAIGDVSGGPSDTGRALGVNVECNLNKVAAPFEEDVQMTIPAGLGECALRVTGEPDTSFVVYEFREPIG
jgi:TonB family protein